MVNFSESNLADANFGAATLFGVDLTNAEVRGATFWHTTDSGFTSAQLYSTASYQAGDLTGISLGDNDLTGWDFAGQNLTDVDFEHATLTGADFTDAEIRGADLESTTDIGFASAQLYSTASYQAGDLAGIRLGDNDLTGWDFSGQDLTDARLESATLIDADLRNAKLTNARLGGTMLTDADLTGAEVQGANFGDATRRGFTSAQLYSTASYQTGDLTGIGFEECDLTSWDFAGQNSRQCQLQ